MFRKRYRMGGIALSALGTLMVAGVFTLGAGSASACEECKGKYEVDGKKSGYLYSTPATQAIQDDDFTNPGFLWVERGRQLWAKKEGEASTIPASTSVPTCFPRDAPAAPSRSTA